VIGAGISSRDVQANGVWQLKRLRDRIRAGQEIRQQIQAELLQTNDLAARQEILTTLADIRRNQLDLIRQAKATIRRTMVILSLLCFGGGDSDIAHGRATEPPQDDPEALG